MDCRKGMLLGSIKWTLLQLNTPNIQSIKLEDYARILSITRRSFSEKLFSLRQPHLLWGRSKHICKLCCKQIPSYSSCYKPTEHSAYVFYYIFTRNTFYFSIRFIQTRLSETFSQWNFTSTIIAAIAKNEHLH